MEPTLARARSRGLSGTEPHGRGTWIGRFILANLRQGSAARRVGAPGVFRPTPVSPLVRVSLAQAFEIQALHLHRHLDQAERVKREVARR